MVANSATKLCWACSKNLMMIYLLPLRVGILVAISSHFFHLFLPLSFILWLITWVVILVVGFFFPPREVSSWINRSNDTVQHHFFFLYLPFLNYVSILLLPSLTLIQLLVSCFLSTVFSVLGSLAGSSADWKVMPSYCIILWQNCIFLFFSPSPSVPMLFTGYNM